MKIFEADSLEKYVSILNTYDFIILHISASWCKPCAAIKDELYHFIENYEKEGKEIKEVNELQEKKDYIFLKLDFDVIDEDSSFEDYLLIKKIPYFACIQYNKIVNDYQSSNVEEIKTFIHSNINQTENFSYEEDF
jgi:thiol-disulfide isomerase/thioredoxin